MRSLPHNRSAVRRLVALGAGLLLAVWAASAGATTTFRVLAAKLSGGKLAVDVAVSQGARAIKLDFYAHKALPKHRNVEAPGVPVTAGLPLGSLTPAAHSTTTATLRLDVAEAEREGLTVGRIVYVALKSPGFGDNGGHEWGVNAGAHAPQYAVETSATITRNARWHPERALAAIALRRAGATWLAVKR